MNANHVVVNKMEEDIFITFSAMFKIKDGGKMQYIKSWSSTKGMKRKPKKPVRVLPKEVKMGEGVEL